VKESRARTVGELAEVVKGRVYGDPQTVIRGIASIEDARTGDITFAESARLLQNAGLSSASAILAPDSAAPDAPGAGGKALIQVANPRLAFAQLLDLFAPEQYAERGVHPTAVIGSDFRHGGNVSVGPHCVLGDNVRLGENVTLHPLVCLGDDVEIGSNVTIDRARTGTTRIGRGTKIDNLVHIGHNCQIGEDCIIVAQVGLAGGVEVGKNVVIAGQSGVKEQVKIGAGAVLGAQTGVMGDVPAGAFVSGYGARPHREVLKTAAAVNQLPDLLKKVRDMERRLRVMEAAGSGEAPEDGAAREAA
jgi:UDP-3-O-[3-hydroxymyristoyl] glucosamine N-acyltransferase